MTINRVVPAGFGLGEKYTSAQCNAMDQNVTNALDKRAGETDTLGSVVSCTGAGRVVPSVIVGANADTTYLVSGGNSAIYLDATITAARAYTLGNTNAQPNDVITLFALPTFTQAITVKDNGGASLFLIGNTTAQDSNWASFVFLSGGWHLFQTSNAARLQSAAFTASGAFNVPSGVSMLRYLAWGGGGGGGGGAGADAGTDHWTTGAGGGGGAMAATGLLAVTPGGTVIVVIGGGGAAAGGGAASSSGADGNNGSDTTLNGTSVARGATGGQGGLMTTVTSAVGYVVGGRPVSGGNRTASNGFPITSLYYLGLGAGPGWGGYGMDNRCSYLQSAADGAYSIEAFAGGLAGSRAGDSGSNRGGGISGGGAAGPGGAGVAGGPGGTGGGFGGTQDGTDVTAVPPANSGAGGGGGGGGGSSATPGVGGIGGAGAAGKAILMWVK